VIKVSRSDANLMTISGLIRVKSLSAALTLNAVDSSIIGVIRGATNEHATKALL
jgi:hypothetical protein